MDIDSKLLPTDASGRNDYLGTTWKFWDLLPGVTEQHLMNPDFWVHVASRLRVNDRIEAITQDGTLDMDVRVIAIDPSPRKLWAKMRVLRANACAGVVAPIPPEQKPEDDPKLARFDEDGYAISWGGPTLKFRIQHRIGDHISEVGRNYPTRGDANHALEGIKAAKKAA